MIQSFRLVSDPMLEKMSLLLATRPLGFENVHITSMSLPLSCFLVIFIDPRSSV